MGGPGRLLAVSLMILSIVGCQPGASLRDQITAGLAVRIRVG